ncbi:copper homeostasis protein CutC [Auraticoccus sp. F435]|uniref:Copper homeostasis protein cutC homolog n=1 Tax=Auraticoccus cholistanensis TaxID=2656650 RepID=A0A6A9UXV8_9ACTN|nr:copper homeostasis protein CutC [Auraticoccus cholistanensis]MVA76542.1 copper homeostasis protein CutC [Auraticoccus cholistanensis]
MSGLLEVLVLHAADARRAVEGGADRLHLVGAPEVDGPSPPPDVVAEVCRAVDVPVRVTLRLREGFGTDGGEVVRLRGLASAYRDAGAEGIVMGFLNGHGDIDLQVLGALLEDGDWPWTCSRAVDQALDTDRSWRRLLQLPRLDQVLTAGSARGVEEGLDELIARARREPEAAALVMAGGDLHPDHLPWLGRAGVRAFHIDLAARPQGSWKAYVDTAQVRSWRILVDDVTRPRG